MNELKKIFDKYGTDKSTFHEYYGPYDENFSYRREHKINLLEIGVRDCKSLRSWKEYFPKGKIYGMDIDPSCKSFESEGFKIIIGDQGNENDLKKFGDTKFDIIIDDGSHFTEHMVSTFRYMFEHHLKSGGVYVIEDLGCSYIRDFHSTTKTMSNSKGQSLNKDGMINERHHITDLFESIHQNMDIHDWNNRYGYNKDGPKKLLYDRMVSYRRMVFIYKS